MSSTPGRRGGSVYSSPAKKVPLRGLFQDGVWHCNCSPRLPASHFLVRKDGPNKGRWFYTCQEPKGAGCSFFLWDDDAKSREMRSVINNSRSEIQEASPSAPTNAAEVDEASNKWMADLEKKDEDEFGDWGLSAEDELQLDRMAASVPPETPRKAIKFTAEATPGSKRKRDEKAFPTPQTAHTDDVFTSPSRTRLKGGMWDGNERQGLLSPSITPTPNKFRDAMQGTDHSGTTDYDITAEVMEALKDQSLNDEVSAKVRQLLNRQALKTSGIAKGREISRIALKKKDEKIAELQQRITALETEREMDKIVIKHFKSDMAESISKRRGKP